MNPVVGIICEYDPFHRGHAHQFEKIRETLPGASIVCLMSGCFTQRGFPSLFPPSFRAKQALLAGADLVLELPVIHSLREGEHFARAGVDILSRLGMVTHLSFGCEGDPARLQEAAQLLEQPTEDFTLFLKEQLSTGVSFAAAQGKALEAVLGSGEDFSRPNNILGICYNRALLRLKSPLISLPVYRSGDYHSLEEQVYPSAGRIRSLFLSGQREKAERECGYSLQEVPFCPPEGLDLLLLAKLRGMEEKALAVLPGCSEGLEKRLAAAAMEAVTGEELRQRIKTRRYSYARISRLCAHALLGVDEAFLTREDRPSYVRILGLRTSSGLTPGLKNSRIPVIARGTEGDESNPAFQADRRAYELWALGAGLPGGYLYRSGVVRVD